MLTDFRNFSTVEFIKKFATNWLSHCPPHLQRVATLPCEMTVVTNSHFHIKTMHSTSIVTNQMSYTVSLWWSSSASYKDCSKCPSFTRTQARSRERHWSIASSMTLCSRLSHTSIAATSFADLTQQFFRVLIFSSFSQEIQQVISYSYNL